MNATTDGTLPPNKYLCNDSLFRHHLNRTRPQVESRGQNRTLHRKFAGFQLPKSDFLSVDPDQLEIIELSTLRYQSSLTTPIRLPNGLFWFLKERVFVWFQVKRYKPCCDHVSSRGARASHLSLDATEGTYCIITFTRPPQYSPSTHPILLTHIHLSRPSS